MADARIAFTEYFRATRHRHNSHAPFHHAVLNGLTKSTANDPRTPPPSLKSGTNVSQPVSQSASLLSHSNPRKTMVWWPSTVTRRKPQPPVETSLSSRVVVAGRRATGLSKRGGWPPISQIMPNPWNTIRTLSAGTWGHGSMDMSLVVYRVERAA